MGFSAIKEKARELFDEASFISHISNDKDYQQALALMDELIEDYFTEEGCGLLLMMARRYLRLLNEGVAQIA